MLLCRAWVQRPQRGARLDWWPVCDLYVEAALEDADSSLHRRLKCSREKDHMDGPGVKLAGGGVLVLSPKRGWRHVFWDDLAPLMACFLQSEGTQDAPKVSAAASIRRTRTSRSVSRASSGPPAPELLGGVFVHFPSRLSSSLPVSSQALEEWGHFDLRAWHATTAVAECGPLARRLQRLGCAWVRARAQCICRDSASKEEITMMNCASEHRSGEKATRPALDEWCYCRLHVGQRLGAVLGGAY